MTTKSNAESCGHFDHESRSYILTSEPPRKWRNIHYNLPADDEIYAETSNLGDGPVVVRDQAGNTCTLTSWDAKYLYLRDDDTHTTFTPWGDPVPTPVTDKRCTFHAAHTTIEGTCAKLRVKQTVFVPLDEPLEIHHVTVTNLSSRQRRVSLFLYVLFQLTGKNAAGGGVWKDNETTVRPDLGGVWAHNRDRSVPTARFNGFVLTTSPQFAGGCGYRDFLTRESYSPADTKIPDGWNCDNRGFLGPDCAGIVQVSLSLAPGEEGRADFLLGCAAAPDELAGIRARWSPAAVDDALRQRIEHELKWRAVVPEHGSVWPV